MKITIGVIAIAIILIGIGLFYPITTTTNRASGTVNNIGYVITPTKDLSYQIITNYTIPYKIIEYGYPFYFKGIDFNFNTLIVNDHKLQVNTTYMVFGSIVEIILTGNTLISKGALNITYSFTARYVLNYSGFSSTNYVNTFNDKGIITYSIGVNSNAMDNIYIIITGIVIFGIAIVGKKFGI